MYKYLISLILFTIASSAFGSNKSWGDLSQSTFYQLDKEIILTDEANTITLKPGMRFKLKERNAMAMIKVELYKFELGTHCPASDMTTDIQLLDVIQSNGKITTVGANLAENCLLEIYVEFLDLNTFSIFN